MSNSIDSLYIENNTSEQQFPNPEGGFRYRAMAVVDFGPGTMQYKGQSVGNSTYSNTFLQTRMSSHECWDSTILASRDIVNNYIPEQGTQLIYEMNAGIPKWEYLGMYDATGANSQGTCNWTDGTFTTGNYKIKELRARFPGTQQQHVDDDNKSFRWYLIPPNDRFYWFKNMVIMSPSYDTQAEAEAALQTQLKENLKRFHCRMQTEVPETRTTPPTQFCGDSDICFYNTSSVPSKTQPIEIPFYTGTTGINPSLNNLGYQGLTTNWMTTTNAGRLNYPRSRIAMNLIVNKTSIYKYPFDSQLFSIEGDVRSSHQMEIFPALQLQWKLNGYHLQSLRDTQSKPQRFIRMFVHKRDGQTTQVQFSSPQSSMYTQWMHIPQNGTWSIVPAYEPAFRQNEKSSLIYNSSRSELEGLNGQINVIYDWNAFQPAQFFGMQGFDTSQAKKYCYNSSTEQSYDFTENGFGALAGKDATTTIGNSFVYRQNQGIFLDELETWALDIFNTFDGFGLDTSFEVDYIGTSEFSLQSTSINGFQTPIYYGLGENRMYRTYMLDANNPVYQLPNPQFDSINSRQLQSNGAEIQVLNSKWPRHGTNPLTKNATIAQITQSFANTKVGIGLIEPPGTPSIHVGLGIQGLEFTFRFNQIYTEINQRPNGFHYGSWEPPTVDDADLRYKHGDVLQTLTGHAAGRRRTDALKAYNGTPH